MKIAYNLIGTKKTINYVILGLIFILLFSLSAIAQENPPIPVQVEVDTDLNLNFGTFTTGNAGGTVIVNSNGSRTSTGDISLVSMDQGSHALFTVTANPGTIITIGSQPITLIGPPGGSMDLKIDSYSTGQTFITRTSTTSVFVGGTLTVGNSSQSPPGQYTEYFTLTFIQQ
jgi:hypothetical protein